MTATTPLPTFISTGSVRGQQIVISGDTLVDADTKPDAAYPVGAQLTFSPTVDYLVWGTSASIPDGATVYLTSVTAVIDSTGEPVTLGGDRLDLVANIGQVGNDQDWYWSVVIKINAKSYPAFRFDVAAGVTNYLGNQQPIPHTTPSSAVVRGPSGAFVGVSSVAALPAVDQSVLNARALLTLPMGYTRDAPGGSWRRTDGDLVVPQWWSDPNNPLQLPQKLAAFAADCESYVSNRSSTLPTTTTAGVGPLGRGLGPSLYFTNDQEWHIQPVAGLNVCALKQKTPVIQLMPALQHFNSHQATLVFHNPNSLACFGIATKYRPFSEDPVRADGDTSPWDPFTFPAQNNDAYSGGRGQGGHIEWRYRKTAQAVITADVLRNQTTISVDNVDGVSRSWFTANGLSVPPELEAAKLSVGKHVWVSMGMNPNDAHEYWDVMPTYIVAINGNTTPGYTMIGSGTITLADPFNVDCIRAQQFWSYPNKLGSTYKYLAAGSGGVENHDAHSIFSIDESIYCTSPFIGDFDLQMAPGTTVAPQSWFSFQSCGPSEFGHLRCFNGGVQIVNHNRNRNARGKRLEMLGVNPGVSGNRNLGMVVDGCTSNVTIDEVRTANFLGAVTQAETNSLFHVRQMFIQDTHPARRANTTSVSACVLPIGGSRYTIDRLRFITGGAGALAGSIQQGSTFEVRSEAIIDVLRPAKGTLRLSDFGPACTIYYNGWKIDGSAPASYRLDKRRRELAVAVTYVKSQTVTEELPAGAIGSGEITLNSDIAGLTSLKLINPYLQSVGGAYSINMFGTTLTDVSGNASDSVGDGYGADADRRITSAGGGLVATTDDPFVWPGGNEDGSTFTCGILDATNAPNSVVLDSLLPRNLVAGTTVRFGDTAIAGQTVKLPRNAYGLSQSVGTGAFSLGKLEAEAAGQKCYLQAIFDGTVDDASGKSIIVDLDTFPIAIPLGGTAVPRKPRIPITGDRQGNAPLAQLLSALRASVRDQTTDSGVPGAIPAYGNQQDAATMLRGEINSVTVSANNDGFMYIACFTPGVDKLISNLNFYTGTTPFASVTLARAVLGLFDEPSGVFTPVAETADFHTAILAAGANGALAIPLANTGRFATPTSYQLRKGTRYGLGFMVKGATAGTMRGAGNMTASISAKTPQLVRNLTGLTDGPTAPVGTSTGSLWLYGYLD